ncbi:MAG: P27 family phage terminase small subunit [Anaerolineaceae bacterium]|nr:P27 family phage terminase small subunit [Anaerolineaceae bacterium]
MPGPLPKDPAIRQRRNKSASKALLPAESLPRIRAPQLPKREDGKPWHPMARAFWKDVWSSPMRSEYLRADEPALFRLVYLVDMFWKTPDLDIAKEIRALEREFGLTPLSRRRLEWTVTQTEEAKDQREQKRVKRIVIIDSDPRDVLDK